jgi:CBS domain-containing protein
MVVGDRMARDLITISPADSCAKAIAVMEAARVDHLPVVEGARLVGLVCELDILRHAPVEAAAERQGTEASFLVHVKVGGVMTYAPVTVGTSAPLALAAATMRDRGVSAIPVVDGDRLVGMITTAEILAALLDVLDGSGVRTSPEG